MNRNELSTQLQTITDAIEHLQNQLRDLPDEPSPLQSDLRDQLQRLFSQMADFQRTYSGSQITERESLPLTSRATQELYEANERLRIIFDSIKDHGVFTLDFDRIVTSWNPGAERMFGWPEEEIVGQSADLIFTPEDRIIGQPENEQRQALEKGVALDKRWHLRKDGSRFYADGTMRQLQDREGNILGFVKVTRDATADVAHQKTEAALRTSEERFRALFNSIDEAFALCEILLDDNGKAIDYRLLEVNPAFEKMTGITPEAAQGSTARELVPGIEDWWIETYADAALNGKSFRFENSVAELERWFDAYVTPVGDQRDGRFVLVFSDISERKRAENVLRASEATQSFLLKLSDALRPLADPVAMQNVATRILGEALSASRVMYVELEANGVYFTIERDYHLPDAPDLSGRYRLDDFGPTMMAELRAGNTLAVTNVVEHPALLPEDQAAYKSMSIMAYAAIPLVKDGQLVAILGIHSIKPRQWTIDEINLMKETAERTWAAAELARAQAAIIQQERRTAEILETIGDVFYAVDENFHLTYLNRRAEEAWGKRREDLLGKHIWSVFPQAVGSESYQRHAQVMRERRPTQFETFSPVVKHWIEGSIYPRESGGLAVYFHDITERKQAEIDERVRRLLAEALRDAASDLSSTLELSEVLDQGMVSARRLLDYAAAYIILSENDVIKEFQCDGLSDDEHTILDRWHRQFAHLSDAPIYRTVTGTELITMFNDQEQAEALLPIRPLHSLSVVPLNREQVTLGYLVLINGQPNERTQPDITTLQAFSYQLVTAISNARLFVQAQELAALQQRQQLARDLHDAVSQTLFTASLMIETTIRQQEKQQGQRALQSQQRLTDVHRLIKGAQAEMRTLLLELRPGNVQTTPMTRLMTQLIDGVKGRKRMEITLDFDGEPVLPPAVHTTFYRIAQEALNNITKHSGAHEAWITGNGGPGFINLRIHDHGAGFDVNSPKAGMGLQIMRERAAEVGATLEIRSVVGDGTEINLHWSE
jgi:PAS domain S-box-containing protein